jgi:hypothetical protein
MKKNATLVLGLIFGLTGFADSAFGQCRIPDSNTKRPFYDVELECAKTNSESSYLTDGKDYRALLSGNEVVEFVSMFYGGNKYRIAACTDVGGPLSFTVKDKRGNVLFTNKEYENAPYWDLEFPSTMECSIFVQLAPETIEMTGGGAVADDGSGTDSTTAKKAAAPAEEVCSVIVIGYKQ